MDETTTPIDIRGYARAIRKGWWQILLAALLFGVLPALLLGSVRPDARAEATLTIRESTAALVIGNLEGPVPVLRRSTAAELAEYLDSELAVLLESDSVRPAFLKGTEGSKVTHRESGGDRITITAQSTSPQKARKTLRLVIDHLQERNRSEAIREIKSVGALAEKTRQSLRSEIAELTGQIAKEVPSSGLPVALAVSRAQLQSRLGYITRVWDFVAASAEDPSGGIARGPIRDLPNRSAFGPSVVGLWSILIAALAAFAIGTRGVHDGRTRTNRDLEKACGPDSLLGTIQAHNEPAFAVAFALRNLLREASDEVTVVLVGSGSRNRQRNNDLLQKTCASVSEGLSALGNSIGAPLRIRGELHGGSEFALLGANAPVVVAAIHGETPVDALRVATNELAKGGVRLLGVILVNTPPKDARRVYK